MSISVLSSSKGVESCDLGVGASAAVGGNIVLVIRHVSASESSRGRGVAVERGRVARCTMALADSAVDARQVLAVQVVLREPCHKLRTVSHKVRVDICLSATATFASAAAASIIPALPGFRRSVKFDRRTWVQEVETITHPQGEMPAQLA